MRSFIYAAKLAPDETRGRHLEAHPMRLDKTPGVRVALAISSLPGMTIHFSLRL